MNIFVFGQWHWKVTSIRGCPVFASRSQDHTSTTSSHISGRGNPGTTNSRKRHNELVDVTKQKQWFHVQ